MSENENSKSKGGSTVSWGAKAGYIGTGILIGLIVYPFVRKTLAKVQPKVDEIFDHLTGKAEDFAERASDLMAKARDNLTRDESEENHSHEHNTAESAPGSN